MQNENELPGVSRLDRYWQKQFKKILRLVFEDEATRWYFQKSIYITLMVAFSHSGVNFNGLAATSPWSGAYFYLRLQHFVRTDRRVLSGWKSEFLWGTLEGSMFASPCLWLQCRSLATGKQLSIWQSSQRLYYLKDESTRQSNMFYWHRKYMTCRFLCG